MTGLINTRQGEERAIQLQLRAPPHPHISAFLSSLHTLYSSSSFDQFDSFGKLALPLRTLQAIASGEPSSINHDVLLQPQIILYCLSQLRSHLSSCRALAFLSHAATNIAACGAHIQPHAAMLVADVCQKSPRTVFPIQTTEYKFAPPVM